MSYNKFPIRESEPQMVEDFGTWGISTTFDPSSSFDGSLNQYLTDPSLGRGSFDGEIFQEDFLGKTINKEKHIFDGYFSYCLASIAPSNDFNDFSFGQFPQTRKWKCDCWFIESNLFSFSSSDLYWSSIDEIRNLSACWNQWVHRSLVSTIFHLFLRLETSKKRIPKENNIKLSGSVGVGQVHTPPRASSKIQLVHPLEETYRPRYKSDYFAQNGTIRKPRYVADREGNHFISLKVIRQK